MTEEIFRRDGYIFEFEAVVVSVDGELVKLDQTAFYPGGGGQVCDTGSIRNCRVTETFYGKDGDIVHRAPKNDLKVGENVWCEVDWDRRYDLMCGHTGEHLLFCSLKKQDPELAITKIFISPESKYVIVNHDISWDLIGKAITFANSAIKDNLTVTKSIMSKDDPELEKVRIKKERIEGDEVSVVSIGDIDLSACSGVHVMETSELGMLFVSRKVSAGKDGIAIHFEIGDTAKNTALGLANICLMTAETANSKSEDLVRAVSNLMHEAETGRGLARSFAEAQIKAVEPIQIGGVDIYSGIFKWADRKTLSDATESIRSKGGIAVMISIGDSLSVLLASGVPKVDCKTILGKVLTEFGGRGGGKPEFAQGGAPDNSAAEHMLESLLEEVKVALN